MDNFTIKRLINFNNKEIEKRMDPSKFVLDTEIQALLEENKKLRSMCKHEFQSGECIYCGATE